MAVFTLLVICLFHVLSTSYLVQVTASDIHVGILDHNHEVPSMSSISDMLDNINSLDSSHNLNITVISMGKENINSGFAVSNIIRNLPTEDDWVFLSTDQCTSSVTDAFSRSSLPLLEVNKEISCLPSPSPCSNTMLLPAYRRFDDVVSHVISRIQWGTVNLFTDGHMDWFVSSLERALETQLVRLQLFRVQAGHTDSQLLDQLHSAVDYLTDKTNILLVCKASTTLRLLYQGSELERHVAQEKGSLHNMRWLLVTSSDLTLDHVLNTLGHINNLAWLRVQLNFTDSLSDRIKNALELVHRAANMPWVPPAQHTCTTEACQRLNLTSHLMLDKIKSVVLNASNSQGCEPYTLYTTSVWGESTTLVQQPLCLPDSLTFNQMTLFPTENYGFNGRYFRVTTMPSPPFMIKEMTAGQVTYTGLCADLLRELALTLNFTYSIVEPKDRQYGASLPDGNWTGMVGQLVRDEVDLSVASLSVSPAREEVIDFVEYYLEYGGLLLRKLPHDEGKWRVILDPFTWPVWLSLMASVPVVGLVATAITRLVQLAFRSTGIVLSDKFLNARDSVWYVFGALLTQGGCYQPETSPGRAFIGMWWLFCIVIVATYGGSLIAYLTVSKSDVPFTSLEELASQERYKWGTKLGSVYANEFKRAQMGVNKALWDGITRFLEEDPDVLSASNAIQRHKVSSEFYGYITDRTPLLVWATEDESCELVMLEETFMPMPMGIGFQKGSSFKALFQNSVKKLRESGLIQFWEQRYWPKPYMCSGIPIPESHAITLLDTQSAFYLLLGGILVACFILIVEHCRSARAVKIQEKQAEKQTPESEVYNYSNFYYNTDSASSSTIFPKWTYSTEYTSNWG